MRLALMALIASTAGCAARDPLTPFRALHRGMTIEQCRAQLGPPTRETGSGLAIDVYRLPNGSEVWLGYAGQSGLIYVHHGKEELLPVDTEP